MLLDDLFGWVALHRIRLVRSDLFDHVLVAISSNIYFPFFFGSRRLESMSIKGDAAAAAALVGVMLRLPADVTPNLHVLTLSSSIAGHVRYKPKAALESCVAFLFKRT